MNLEGTVSWDIQEPQWRRLEWGVLVKASKVLEETQKLVNLEINWSPSLWRFYIYSQERNLTEHFIARGWGPPLYWSIMFSSYMLQMVSLGHDHMVSGKPHPSVTSPFTLSTDFLFAFRCFWVLSSSGESLWVGTFGTLIACLIDSLAHSISNCLPRTSIDLGIIKDTDMRKKIITIFKHFHRFLFSSLSIYIYICTYISCDGNGFQG